MKNNTMKLKKQAKEMGYELSYNRTLQTYILREFGSTNEQEIGSFEQAQEYIENMH